MVSRGVISSIKIGPSLCGLPPSYMMTLKSPPTHPLWLWKGAIHSLLLPPVHSGKSPRQTIYLPQGWIDSPPVLQHTNKHLLKRNSPSDVCYDDTKHYQVSSEKQDWCKVCGENSRRRVVKYKEVYIFIFWNIPRILANVWLRNVSVLISSVEQNFRSTISKLVLFFLFNFS